MNSEIGRDEIDHSFIHPRLNAYYALGMTLHFSTRETDNKQNLNIEHMLHDDDKHYEEKVLGGGTI